MSGDCNSLGRETQYSFVGSRKERVHFEDMSRWNNINWPL